MDNGPVIYYNWRDQAQFTLNPIDIEPQRPATCHLYLIFVASPHMEIVKLFSGTQLFLPQCQNNILLRIKISFMKKNLYYFLLFLAIMIQLW